MNDRKMTFMEEKGNPYLSKTGLTEDGEEQDPFLIPFPCFLPFILFPL
jgi:hypothetical protein